MMKKISTDEYITKTKKSIDKMELSTLYITQRALLSFSSVSIFGVIGKVVLPFEFVKIYKIKFDHCIFSFVDVHIEEMNTIIDEIFVIVDIDIMNPLIKNSDL